MARTLKRQHRTSVDRTPHYRTLADYLARSGDSQVALAARMHVSQAQISRIVSGISVPRGPLAFRLAAYCNIPIESFTKVYCARRVGGKVA